MPIDPDIPPILDALEQRIQAQLDAQRATLDEHTRHFANTGDQINALNGADKALERQLADLAARVAKLEQGTPDPDPEPVVGGTWWGYTYSGVGTSLNQQPGIVRDFTGGQNIEASKIARTLTRGVPLWYSWKPDITGTSWPNNVESTLRSTVKPTHPPLLICVWHEPEGSGDAGGGTPEVRIPRWQAAHRALHDIALRLRADGLPVFVWPIICDWTFWWTDKGSATEWYSADFCKHIDGLGTDLYPQGQQKSGVGRIARLTTLGPNQPAPYDHTIRTDIYKASRLWAKLAKDRGLPWGSGETGLIDGSVSGADVQYPYTRAQRADRFRVIANDLTVQLPAEGLPAPTVMALYNDGGCNVTNAPDTTTVAAWNDLIATNPPIAQLKEAV